MRNRVPKAPGRGRPLRFAVWLTFAHYAMIALTYEQAGALERECKTLFSPFLTSKPQFSRLIVEITDEPLAELIDGSPKKFWPPVVKIRNSAGEITLDRLQELASDDSVLNSIAPSARIYVFAVGSDGRRRELPLAVGLKRSLREYIRLGGPPTMPFNCNCFVHLMHGLPYDHRHFRTRLWDLDLIYDESALLVGDTIVLGYSFSEIKHVAIFLGKGLYISKMGDGPVLVTDFATLQLGYGGVMLARGRPTLNPRGPEIENAN